MLSGNQHQAPAKADNYKADGTQYFPIVEEYFQQKAFNFCWLDGLGLTLSERLLLKFMTIKAGHAGYVLRFSKSFLRPSGLGEGTAKRSLQVLAAHGYIECLELNTRQGNVYQVNPVLRARTGGFHLATDTIRMGVFSNLLTPSEQWLLEYLSYRALCVEKTLHLTLKLDRMVELTGLSIGTIRRSRLKLSHLRLLSWDEEPKPKVGNRYYLNPILIHAPKAAKEGLRLSDHFGPAGGIDDHVKCDHFGPAFRSFWPGSKLERACQCDHFGPQYYSFINSLTRGNAPRRAHNSKQGGENARLFAFEGEQRCPTGQDQKPGDEGGRLSPAKALERKAELLRQLAELERHLPPVSKNGEQVPCPA